MKKTFFIALRCWGGNVFDGLPFSSLIFCLCAVVVSQFAFLPVAVDTRRFLVVSECCLQK